MRLTVVFLFVVCLPLITRAQAVMTTSGNWNVASKWSGSNIGDLITENVTINTNINATVIGSDNYTVGNVTMTSSTVSSTLSVAGTLTLGASGNPKNLTLAQNDALSITGTLEIWGDLLMSGTGISITSSGTLIVHGNITKSDASGFSYINSGIFQLSGNLTATGNVTIINSGNSTISGAVSVGSGSTLTTSGTFKVHQCSAPTPFCLSAGLPIQLLFFKGAHIGEINSFSWATATEINNDFFTLQRSLNTESFEDVRTISGAGNSTGVIRYAADDQLPPFGNVYYRLKQTDFDKRSTYSNLIMLENSVRETGLLVSPNPARIGDELVIHTEYVGSSAYGEPVNTGLYDIYGRLIQTYLSSLENQPWKIKTDDGLTPGIYFLKIVNPVTGENQTQRVVLLR